MYHSESTDDECCVIESADDIAEYEYFHDLTFEMVSKYLDYGKYKDKLKSVSGIGFGFGEGCIEIVYKK